MPFTDDDFDDAVEKIEGLTVQQDKTAELFEKAISVLEAVAAREIPAPNITVDAPRIPAAQVQHNHTTQVIDMAAPLDALKQIISSLNAQLDLAKKEKLEIFKLLGNLRTNDYAKNIDALSDALRNKKEISWEGDLSRDPQGRVNKIILKPLEK